MQYIILLFLVATARKASCLQLDGKLENEDCSSYICESVRMILQYMVTMDERIKKIERYSSEFENAKKELADVKEHQNVLITGLRKDLNSEIDKIRKINETVIADVKEHQNFMITGLKKELNSEIDKIRKINETVIGLAYKKIGSKSYFIVDTEKRSWNDSREFCHNLGGHLVSLQSQSELDALGRELKDQLYWTDVHDFSNEGEFLSDTTGQKPNFFNWRQNPDNWNNEDCVEIGGYPNFWAMNDNECSTLLNFICEK
ncbi:accessory gland protein Acp29AB-like [Drosophila ficusphila]|uniref:accessory gland protein Acp29AB-like n=1 Tax=Drosophila ficusphila TaxID=30025 RepID=UPI001C8A0470|nr:accessory gland protein Acp29AB-like [Drosophila ficusphila]